MNDVETQLSTEPTAVKRRRGRAADGLAPRDLPEPVRSIVRILAERGGLGATELYAIDRRLLTALGPLLERRMAFGVSVHDREIYVSIGTETLSGSVTRHLLEQ